MNKFMKLVKNTRVIVLLVFLIMSVVVISPGFSSDGVAIRNVAHNSSAAQAGIESPQPTTPPMNREVILSINNAPITDEVSYNAFVSTLNVDDQVIIKTTQQTYFLTVLPEYEVTILNKTQIVETVEEVFNETTNTTQNVTTFEHKPVINRTLIGPADLGLSVYNRPTNNIRKGLDLEGGTRVLLEPENEVTEAELDIIIGNIKQRLNVFGVSDVIVRSTKDFSGNVFVAVEIAGVNKEEVRELLSQQGKFEARVGSETVFLGGEDVAYVCRTSDCSGIDPQFGCGPDGAGQFICGFRFAISLSPEAAQRQADATRNLAVEIGGSGQSYLSENLTLYLDDQLVDQLRIASELKGSAQTEISISGSGVGGSEQEAITNTLANMKELQTILITGSLPVKMNVVKTDSISPLLGASFVQNVLFIGLIAIIAVVAVVIIRYREWKVFIPMIVTIVSEVVILLGAASLIGWRLDLAAIAGIIIAVGTGIDDQIVIADETLKKKKEATLGWKDRIKRAFFIIMASYFTTVVAMLPLWFAGAGLLKGFALTTILGVSIGVLITRPVFAAIIELLVED